MKMENNKSLYWYGWRARVKKVFGKAFLVTGFFALMFDYIISGILVIVGIFLLATGSSSEYDYKRTGGHILYND